jgi:uncharacterized protein (TIGR03118 family)
MKAKQTLLLATAIFTISYAANATEDDSKNNKYQLTNFVANKAKYSPELGVEKNFINAWGISIRPAGAGGHFWVTAKDVSYEYVGDVKNSPDAKLQKLHQDELKTITLPVGGDDKFATGTVFSDSKENFVITQKTPAGDLTAPAKFLFASDGGIISAWTERKKEDGTFDRASNAEIVIDESKSGAQFFGLAISSNYDLLYAADFGEKPAIKVYDGKFKPADIVFDQPFDDNKNGVVDAGEYAPFNIQGLKTPEGKNNIFVTYAKTQACPTEEVKSGTCKKGELFVGEEDTSKPGYGKIAEFTEEGKLVKIWQDGGKLSAPWGVAFAPENFGAFSGDLLVANFGDGTIAALDEKTTEFTGVLSDKKNKPIIVDKVWGILFGNGASLGDTNTLYFAAGPDDEKDGVFGKIELTNINDKNKK